MKAKLVNEAIKHLSPYSKEEVRKNIHKLFDNLISTNLGEKLQLYRDKIDDVNTSTEDAKMYNELIFQSERFAETMGSDIGEIEFIQDTEKEYRTLDKFFEELSVNEEKRINLPFEVGTKISVFASEGYSRGLFHIYPEIKIAYLDSDDYDNVWYFDFPFLMKNLDKHIDTFTKEKINEGIKHLKGLTPKEYTEKLPQMEDDFYEYLEKHFPYATWFSDNEIEFFSSFSGLSVSQVKHCVKQYFGAKRKEERFKDRFNEGIKHLSPKSEKEIFNNQLKEIQDEIKRLKRLKVKGWDKTDQSYDFESNVEEIEIFLEENDKFLNNFFPEVIKEWNQMWKSIVNEPDFLNWQTFYIRDSENAQACIEYLFNTLKPIFKVEINEAYDYFKTHLQIYSNNDPNDFYNYIVLKGNDLYNVRLVKGEHWQWKYKGQIDKNKYTINGKLISNPSMKLITIFQKQLKTS